MKSFLIPLALFGSLSLSAQTGQIRQVAVVGFYNVENLFDPVNSADYIDGTKALDNPAFHRSIPRDSIPMLEHSDYRGPWFDSNLIGKKAVRNQILSTDFTPLSSRNYTQEIYDKKLHNLATVISELGSQYSKTAPVILGMAEIENRQVVEDLIAQPELAPFDYGIVHFNSYDARGIDTGLIYQKRRFKLTKAWKKELKIFNAGKREYTRDIVVALGELDGEKFAFFVNHWPSRRGGEAVSLPKRNAAAALLKQQMDSVRTLDPEYRLIAMGDFNDDPVSPSIRDYLKATGEEKKVGKDFPYFNPMFKMYKKGVATLAYRDAPNLFDQIIISENLLPDKNKSAQKEYTMYTTQVYAPPYLFQKEGNFKGYPFRSWVGETFTNGYSDHFPVFMLLQRAAPNP